MNKFQYSKIHNKLKRKFISFFRDSNPTYLNLSYLLILFIPIFLLSFQNCRTTDIDTSLGGSRLAEVTYERGQIIEIDTTDGAVKEDRLLPSNSDIKFQLIGADPVSDNYKWSIQRGFESIVTNSPTTVDTYQTKFSQLGTHDVSANAYQSSAFKTRASKRLVVGESCSLNDILEIELSSDSAASLKTGASDAITFALKDSASFSSIQWKATLPSGETTTNETDVDTLEVDLSSENPGTLLIEVSATSSDSAKAGCLTYRKKEVTVTSNVTPYFNPLDFTDGTNNIPVILENNHIYKYERSETTRFVQIEVLNADSCQYQANNSSKIDFSCDGELIEIPASSGTDCIEGTITLFASNTQGQSSSQSYYYYCEEDGDYCYFGPTDERLGSHVCPITQSSQRDIQSQKRSDFEVDPSVTTTTSSTITPPATTAPPPPPVTTAPPPPPVTTAPPPPITNSPPVNGVCNNSVRNGCSKGTANDNAIADTSTLYKWHCVGSNGGNTVTNCQKAKSVNGVCNNSVRNGCSTGTANPSAIADTNTLYRWHCVGSNGGNTATNCQKAKSTTEHGQCNNNVKYSCSSSAATTNKTASGGYDRWHCPGSGNPVGNTATNCQARIPNCLTSTSCNNSKPTNSTCRADSNGCYSWSCNTGYSKSGNLCALPPPSSCTCDNSVVNGCGNTCSASQRPSDTPTLHRWTCTKSGYTSSDTCSSSCPSGQYTSSSTCNSGKPAYQTCQQQTNGCYQRTGSCPSGQYTSSSACNSGKPAYQTCQQQTNGCYQRTGSCPSGQYTLSSACNNANPSNSTCSSQGNGCYAWTCDTDYRKSVNSCVTCTTSNSCDSSKPANSTCNRDSNGCYNSWSCNTGYRKSGNSCVTCTTSSSCDSTKPANSTCNRDSNGCYNSWSCNTGYSKSGNSCVTCTTSSSCNRTKPANSTCNRDSNGCYNSWSCNTGYSKSGNSCVTATVNGQCNNNVKYGCTSSAAATNKTASGGYDRWYCPGSGTPAGTTARSCQKTIPNCSTSSSCNRTKPANSTCNRDSNGCYNSWSCNTGYSKSGNSCVTATVNGQCNNNVKYGCTSSAAATNKTASGGYDRWHCPGSGTPAGTTARSCQKTIPNCSTSSSCNRTKPANSTCNRDSNGCYNSWSCNTGYSKSGNSCVTATVNGQCNNNVKYGCTSSAAATNKTASGGYDRWHCPGSGTPAGTTARSCQKTIPNCSTSSSCNRTKPANSTCNRDSNGCYNSWSCNTGYSKSGNSCVTATVNGQCNNNVKYGCTSSAAATNKTASGGYDRWHCPGSGTPKGNTATTCRKLIPTTVHGQCNNNTKYGCSSPAAAINKTASGGYDRWHCPGSGTPAGTTARSCQKTIPNCSTSSSCNRTKPANSTCNRDSNGCYNSWSCNTGYSKSGNSCVTATVNGQCNNNVKYGCTSSAAATNKTASGGYDRWHCPGSGTPKGNTATTCRKLIPTTVHGQCNNNTKYGCSSPAAAINKTASGGYDRWHCPGAGTPKGNTATTCRKLIPLPACDCAGGNSTCGGGTSPNALNTTCCKKGYFHPHPVDTTTYNWTCAASPSANGPSAGQPQVCQSSIRCFTNKPSCTGSGEYTSSRLCQSGLPSTQECYQSGSCWKRRAKPECTCGPKNLVHQCGNGCTATNKTFPTHWGGISYSSLPAGFRYKTRQYTWSCEGQGYQTASCTTKEAYCNIGATRIEPECRIIQTLPSNCKASSPAEYLGRGSCTIQWCHPRPPNQPDGCSCKTHVCTP